MAISPKLKRNTIMSKQITITLPSVNIKPALARVKGMFKRQVAVATKAATYGCYKEKETGTWYSYWKIGSEVHMVLTPEGVNAKAYASQHRDILVTGDDVVSYECECDKCAATGQAYGGKCFKCDGKGWMSPIDVARATKFEKKVAAVKRQATAAKRKARSKKTA